MTIRLEPPYTRSARNIGNEPVMEGPLLVRTREMTRWHRPKSGVRFADEDRIAWQLWCGQSAQSTRSLGIDALPADGLPICGPCEGKALGAGYNGTAAIVSGESVLLFEPESQTRYRTPAVCPGTGTTLYGPLDEPHDYRVARCLACRLIVRLGTKGRGPYSSSWSVVGSHSPLNLVDPCPWHAWDSLRVRDGVTGCSCHEGSAA